MKVNDIVKCVRSGTALYLGALYRVAVVVEKGQDYHGSTQGVIVIPQDTNDNLRWPYVWDMDRFEVVGSLYNQTIIEVVK